MGTLKSQVSSLCDSSRLCRLLTSTTLRCSNHRLFVIMKFFAVLALCLVAGALASPMADREEIVKAAEAEKIETAPVVEEPKAPETPVETPVAAPEPVAETPAVEEPVAEIPIAAEPIAEEPVAAEPAVEEPVAAEPVVAEPVVEEPVAEVEAP